jgi:hypothetical protein
MKLISAEIANQRSASSNERSGMIINAVRDATANPEKIALRCPCNTDISAAPNVIGTKKNTIPNSLMMPLVKKWASDLNMPPQRKR